MAGFHAVKEFRQRPWPIGGQAEHSAEFHSSTPVSPPTAAALSGVCRPKSTQRFCDNDMHKSKGLNASLHATRSRTPAPSPDDGDQLCSAPLLAFSSNSTMAQPYPSSVSAPETGLSPSSRFLPAGMPVTATGLSLTGLGRQFLGKRCGGTRYAEALRFRNIGRQRRAAWCMTPNRCQRKSESIFGKDHARNQSATVSFARPNERAALSS
ncbi:hypothetical protein [Mesorhizobium sp. M00.F.Ca.ET.216.01.1.1]|uniref:hypothetical protein n=1 Tax=Mesorhizobium sp. M00.F.Ca.ET.216.01.1.1 TaxID=2500528 RepID=UPI001677D835|nr:hypothetical protein [Mesorhizobium sp. M00.F.Ca.ET.216.01.1.1]